MKTAHNQLSIANKRQRRSGFSLIELMIVISLFTITTIVVTTSYISFQGRETLKNGALQLKSDLRYAQNKAQTGDKVSDATTSLSACSSTVNPPGTLVGWYVVLTPGSSSYTINGDCLTGISEQAFGAKTVSLPTGVTIQAITYGSALTEAAILFKPLNYSVGFFDHTVIDWLTLPNFVDDTGVARLGLSTASLNEIVIMVHSSDGDYEIHVTGNGEINEVKI